MPTICMTHAGTRLGRLAGRPAGRRCLPECPVEHRGVCGGAVLHRRAACRGHREHSDPPHFGVRTGTPWHHLRADREFHDELAAQPVGSAQRGAVQLPGTVRPGPALLAKAALAHLQATRGRMVLIGSVAGFKNAPGNLYSATKWAVTALAENIRLQTTALGVGVTLIAPGMTATPFWKTGTQPPRRCPARQWPRPSVSQWTSPPVLTSTPSWCDR